MAPAFHAPQLGDEELRAVRQADRDAVRCSNTQRHERRGEGVVVGPTATQSEWESNLDRALADETPWVVQRLASIPVKPFHVLDDSGGLHVEPFFVVMGLRRAATVWRWLRAHRSGRS